LLPLIFAAILIAAAVYMYRNRTVTQAQPPIAMTDDSIRQEWRKLGFYCEMDREKKLWTLTGSRAGLLYFPDLLLGYVADPKNAADSEHEHYGPYGTLEIMTWPDAGFDSHAIRGSLVALAHLATVLADHVTERTPDRLVARFTRCTAPEEYERAHAKTPFDGAATKVASGASRSSGVEKSGDVRSDTPKDACALYSSATGSRSSVTRRFGGTANLSMK